MEPAIDEDVSNLAVKQSLCDNVPMSRMFGIAHVFWAIS